MRTRMVRRNRVQCFKDPWHKSFLHGVSLFLCLYASRPRLLFLHRRLGKWNCMFASWGKGPWGLKRDHTVSASWSCDPWVSQETRNPNSPSTSHSARNFLLKIHQLTRKEVKCRATILQRAANFISQNCYEPVICRVISGPKVYYSFYFYFEGCLLLI